ncbi:MAG: RNase adapter RapZ [Bdellovibrionota bacterium]
MILITGISGAGKSSVLHSLADLGYYAIDNLPVSLLETFLEFSATAPDKFKRTALLLDVYSLDDEQTLLKSLGELKLKQQNMELFFIDCRTETIIKRYSETRRPHPAFNADTDRGLSDTIARERDRLMSFKDIATFIIDTSYLNIHDLRRKIRDFVDSHSKTTSTNLRVNFISFGFKKGLPRDCDIVMDVRFLSNPYFIPELRSRTGLDQDVRDFVEKQPATKDFIEKYSDLLNFLLPQYVFEGKSYLSIGIGCTGGQHRSVAIAEILASKITDQKYLVSIQHRDL